MTAVAPPPAEEMCPGACGCRLGTDDPYDRRCTCDSVCSGWQPAPPPCTFPGAHDDDADCDQNEPCSCGEYLDLYCARHGDPCANLP